MKLFLASEAKNSLSFPRLTQFVGGSFAGKKIAYIPTAANGIVWETWRNGETHVLLQSLGADLRMLELEKMNSIEVEKELNGVDIIWMAGGMCGYLMYWLRRFNLDTIIPQMVENGTIYIGSSAGSMICSQKFSVAEWLLGDGEYGANIFPGLGFFDFEIYPHYQDSLLPEIEKLWQEGTLYLIKDGEAIIIDNEKIEVFGEKRILEK